MSIKCRPGNYGVYRVITGPFAGTKVYYDDDSMERRTKPAICYLNGTPKYEFFAHNQLERVLPDEAREFEQNASNLIIQLMRA